MKIKEAFDKARTFADLGAIIDNIPTPELEEILNAHRVVSRTTGLDTRQNTFSNLCAGDLQARYWKMQNEDKVIEINLKDIKKKIVGDMV